MLRLAGDGRQYCRAAPEREVVVRAIGADLMVVSCKREESVPVVQNADLVVYDCGGVISSSRRCA